MKKTVVALFLILCFALVACSNSSNSNSNSSKNATSTQNSSTSQNGGNTQNDDIAQSETKTYETAAGLVEIPVNPQRIVILSGSYAGHALFLGAPVVGVESYTYENPLMADYLEGVAEVNPDNLEQIIELEPDLIIAEDNATNLKQLSEIAPTLGLTYSSQTYLSRLIEIGKIVNKEKEAREWVEDFEARAIQAGNDIRAKLGDDVTVTIIESWDKELYVFGDNYGRGTEILYDAMKLKRTDEVNKLVSDAGYSAISPEILPQLGGDFLVFSKSSTADNSFLETETYKNLESVKNNRVLTADAAQFYFDDPVTLEYQLQFFIEGIK